MKSKISLKMRLIELNAWNYRQEPIYAICGVNDTGSSEDSPTNNAFCVAKYIVVSEEDRYKALDLIDHLLFETRLLYMCRRSHYKNQYEGDLPF